MFNTAQFNIIEFNSATIDTMTTAKTAVQWRPTDSGTASPDNAGFFLLLENGHHLLLETGDKMLLEDTAVSDKQPIEWREN